MSALPVLLPDLYCLYCCVCCLPDLCCLRVLQALSLEAQTPELAARTLVSGRVTAWEAGYPVPLAQARTPPLACLPACCLPLACLPACLLLASPCSYYCLQHCRCLCLLLPAAPPPACLPGLHSLPLSVVAPLPPFCLTACAGSCLHRAGRRSGHRDCCASVDGAGSG